MDFEIKCTKNIGDKVEEEYFPGLCNCENAIDKIRELV